MRGMCSMGNSISEKVIEKQHKFGELCNHRFQVNTVGFACFAYKEITWVGEVGGEKGSPKD